MISVPSASSTPTHDVFPPKVSVSGPGVASDPRQPQIFARTCALLPEDRDHAEELLAALEQRERRHRELVLRAVEAGDAQVAVGRPPLEERDPARHLLEGKRLAVERLDGEGRLPFARRDLARGRERAAE